MHKFFVTLLFIIFNVCGFSQQLVFTNVTKNKVITAQIGNMVYLTYNGYNGQHEYITNIITDITDSTISIGLNPGTFNAGKKYNASANSFKVINIKDITAFRKRSVGGVVINSLVTAGSLVGSVFLLSDLINANNISTGNALLISIGSGLIVRYTTLLIFPVNAKYKIKDGWVIKAVNTVE